MPNVVYDANKPAGDVADEKLSEKDQAEGKQEASSGEIDVLNSVMPEEKPQSNPFTTFSVLPPYIHADVQKSDEVILLMLRRHVITNVGWVLTGLIMLLAPLVLSFFPLLEALPGRFQGMTLVLWYLITTGFILEQFLSWYFHVFFITNRRVIDIDFLNLIYKSITSAKIQQIQDITVRVKGVIPSLFNYGNVYIQTAAATPEIRFDKVPQPKKAARFLNELLAYHSKKG